MVKAILAIDQGTTNSKAVLLTQEGEIVARGSCPAEIAHPRSGWVEQDAAQLWESQLSAIRACLAEAPDAKLVAIGISSQRESVLAWERRSGAPLGPLISWQCRRTANACDRLKAEGVEPDVLARTGLPLDPMFPATKLAWLLQTCGDGRGAEDICLGTVDSWLIWKLSGGQVHATDASNAARTQLYNIRDEGWDPHLCAVFGVSESFLPEVRDSSTIFAETRGVEGLPDGIPIAAAIGDSHAALFGHGAFETGDGKVTFGTGSSVMTTMPAFKIPEQGITTTIAWSIGRRPTYAFEGNILVSAAILPWTAKLLGLSDVDALMNLAQSVEDSNGVSLVPAHVGLGAPHWNATARGLISGLSFGAEPAHIARAAVESIPLQVNDVFRAMSDQADHPFGRLFVDGGPSRNTFLMGQVARFLQHPVRQKDSPEASALGAGYLAGLATGVWRDLDEIERIKAPSLTIEPAGLDSRRAETIENWQAAIARSTLVP